MEGLNIKSPRSGCLNKVTYEWMVQSKVAQGWTHEQSCLQIDDPNVVPIWTSKKQCLGNRRGEVAKWQIKVVEKIRGEA